MKRKAENDIGTIAAVVLAVRVLAVVVVAAAVAVAAAVVLLVVALAVHLKMILVVQSIYASVVDIRKKQKVSIEAIKNTNLEGRVILDEGNSFARFYLNFL